MNKLIIQMRITYLKLKKKTDFLWIFKKKIDWKKGKTIALAIIG
jgi:hypothetical protein